MIVEALFKGDVNDFPLARCGPGRHSGKRIAPNTGGDVAMAEEEPTERVVRVRGEFSLLPQHLGEDVKALKARVILDPRFQMVHYLDAEGLQRTASGSADDLAPVLKLAGYLVGSGSPSS
jgi:hypothetical protein